ncbi:5-formyltetrahydrofolate cyclo-ligase [Halobacteriovorax sp. HLS]|uniref:5-formyltetrahydrofolate cyclo-ligase n=1 Tax=Halobacteriovorax sp. HLS TaxID=2234000 RepID=UPI0013E3E334|nr:5-formyltetrahydrofolate cyclo-ligase [Halobacteriovorax sp. HLS]
MKKSQLRKKIKQSLANIDNDLKILKEERCARHFISLLESLKFSSSKKVIGLFAPMSDEVNIISSLSEYKDRSAFPCVNDAGEMVFKMSSFQELENSRYFGVDILGPNKNALEVIPDLILVPGLAFGTKGERLGRGKGYYDKYLERKNILTIGLGLSDQIFSELPMSEHDCFMNWIVTDEEIIEI